MLFINLFGWTSLFITGLIVLCIGVMFRFLKISLKPIDPFCLWISIWFVLYTFVRRYWMFLYFHKHIPTLFKIKQIHSSLLFHGGTMEDEIVEQIMSVKYIHENDHVLELGGNIGRNSLVIASLLKHSENLVVFESDPISANMLEKNRDANGFQFTIHSKALSSKPLIQNNEWISRPLEPNEEIPKGWFPLETMSFSSLKETTPFPFNVLVCDCEGCVYHILKDEPTFFDTFNKVLLENDFGNDPKKAEFVHSRLQTLGFKVVFEENVFIWRPSSPAFWQTWVRGV